MFKKYKIFMLSIIAGGSLLIGMPGIGEAALALQSAGGAWRVTGDGGYMFLLQPTGNNYNGIALQGPPVRRDRPRELSSSTRES